MSTFQHRHYEKVAQTLKDCLASAEWEWEGVENTTEALIKMFKEDNPKFQAGKFRVACGLRLR